MIGVPKGIRTPVAAVKGQCPRPLDDGDNLEGVILLQINVFLSKNIPVKKISLIFLFFI